MTLIQDVAAYLASEGHGTVGRDIFVGTLPTKPIDAVAVLLSGGPADGGDPIRRPMFQILIRNRSEQQITLKGEQLYLALKNKWNVLTEHNGRIQATNEPGPIGKDPGDVPVMSLNFEMSLTP